MQCHAADFFKKLKVIFSAKLRQHIGIHSIISVFEHKVKARTAKNSGKTDILYQIELLGFGGVSLRSACAAVILMGFSIKIRSIYCR